MTLVNLAVLVVQAAAVTVLDAVMVGAVGNVDFSMVLAAHRDLRLHPLRVIFYRPWRATLFDDGLLHLCQSAWMDTGRVQSE